MKYMLICHYGPELQGEELREGPAGDIISVVSQRWRNCYAWLFSPMCDLVCFLPYSFPNAQCSSQHYSEEFFCIC